MDGKRRTPDTFTCTSRVVKVSVNICVIVSDFTGNSSSLQRMQLLSRCSYLLYRQAGMGNSRKYPYPTTDGFHVLTPPLPSEISKCVTPPCPQNSTIVNPPPSPSEFPFFLEVHFRLSNTYMNKRT